jgi:hypothetical protein
MKKKTWLSALTLALLMTGSVLALKAPAPQSRVQPAEPVHCKVKPGSCPKTGNPGDMVQESLSRQFL